MVHVQVVMTGMDPITCTHSGTRHPRVLGAGDHPAQRQVVLYPLLSDRLSHPLPQLLVLE